MKAPEQRSAGVWRFAPVLLMAAALPAAAWAEEPPADVQPAPVAAVTAPGVTATAFPTAKEKFRDYLVRTAGPGRLFSSAFTAALQQSANEPEEWGQGWDAYGRRYGHKLAYNGIRQTITLGASFAFREDNRYVRSGATGFGPRLLHALASPFTARHPDGHVHPSVSTAAGYAGASAISSTWGPPGWKGAKNIAIDTGIAIAGSAAYNVVLEFLPKRLRGK